MEANITKGVVQDFTGVCGETNIFEVPITDKNGADVALAGSTIVMKTSTTKGGDQTNRSDLVTKASPNVLVYDLSTLPSGNLFYETVVTLSDSTIFILNGKINLQRVI